jgi:D-aminopeptidase
VGQHAKAGTEYSHLTHTGWFDRLDTSINAVSVGEYGMIVFCAGELGIPVIFASGEKALAKEAESLTPDVITAAVKEGTMPGRGDELAGEQYVHFHEGAIHLSPARSRDLIYIKARDAAQLFHKDPARFAPYTTAGPYTLVEKFRPYKGQAARTVVREGATSVIDLLNGGV